MNNFKLNLGQNCNLSRSERRAIERKFNKGLSNAKILIPNAAFIKVQPELEKLGWVIHENFLNSVEIGNKWSHTLTPALKLCNEKLNITIISHDNGIEISRLVVNQEYQSQGLGGMFLIMLLLFLIKQEIKDIYVYPGVVGLKTSNQSLSRDFDALKRFYSKRGFLKQERNPYWKLDVNTFLSLCTIKSADKFLLSGSFQKTENSKKK